VLGCIGVRKVYFRCISTKRVGECIGVWAYIDINPNKPLWEVSADKFGRVIDVNLKGVHNVIRAFLPDMIRSGKGVVALNPGIIDTRMLRSCFGEEAGSYPTPEEWSKVVLPFLTSLGARHNGRALTVLGM
jgi:NAD(P)-dependent dehydrogenase (short-subunit alcohol dehydrogenase family)